MRSWKSIDTTGTTFPSSKDSRILGVSVSWLRCPPSDRLTAATERSSENLHSPGSCVCLSEPSATPCLHPRHECANVSTKGYRHSPYTRECLGSLWWCRPEHPLHLFNASFRDTFSSSIFIMKYSISSSVMVGRSIPDLGVNLSISISSTMLVAVPGIGTNVATALDEDDDDDRSSRLSRHSSMSGAKVTLFDVLLGLGATLASDQSTSSYCLLYTSPSPRD